jgi:hypothetical protein
MVERWCIRRTEEGVKPELHSMKKLRHLLEMAVLVRLGIVCSTDAAAQDVVVIRAPPREIWLAPQGINHPSVDFAALFQPDAPWKDAASHCAEDQSRPWRAQVRRYERAVLLRTLLPGTSAQGLGCHSTVQEIMALSKLTLSVYPQEFPGIVIGEVEPTSYIDGEPGWQVDLQEWAAEFRAAMETPIAFIKLMSSGLGSGSLHATTRDLPISPTPVRGCCAALVA